MKKIAIIGLPGSGKSTFARKLAALFNIPVHHLDKHMFEPDGTKKDKQEFLAIQKAILDESAWIIEGCSFSTFELRFARADTIIYFHYSRLLCIWRLFKRFFNYDPAFGGLRSLTWEIIRYLWTFDRDKRERIEQLRKQYPEGNFILFKSPKDAAQFLEAHGAH